MCHNCGAIYYTYEMTYDERHHRWICPYCAAQAETEDD